MVISRCTTQSIWMGFFCCYSCGVSDISIIRDNNAMILAYMPRETNNENAVWWNLFHTSNSITWASSWTLLTLNMCAGRTTAWYQRQKISKSARKKRGQTIIINKCENKCCTFAYFPFFKMNGFYCWQKA